MNEPQERPNLPTDEVVSPDPTLGGQGAETPTSEPNQEAPSTPAAALAELHAGTVDSDVAADEGNTNGAADWHAEAGRKGANRVHQLIKEGKLYEQEHGLKSGRQRLRQLIELGKLYEQEHGLRPRPKKKKAKRLTGLKRQELLATLLQCLLRLARPSFRGELERLIEDLRKKEEGPTA
jgi:hypothetical protein